MQNSKTRSIITIIVAIILFVIAFKLISWAAFKLLPLAIVIVAGYIVYRIVTGKKS